MVRILASAAAAACVDRMLEDWICCIYRRLAAAASSAMRIVAFYRASTEFDLLRADCDAAAANWAAKWSSFCIDVLGLKIAVRYVRSWGWFWGSWVPERPSRFWFPVSFSKPSIRICVIKFKLSWDASALRLLKLEEVRHLHVCFWETYSIIGWVGPWRNTSSHVWPPVAEVLTRFIDD